MVSKNCVVRKGEQREVTHYGLLYKRMKLFSVSPMMCFKYEMNGSVYMHPVQIGHPLIQTNHFLLVLRQVSNNFRLNIYQDHALDQTVKLWQRHTKIFLPLYRSGWLSYSSWYPGRTCKASYWKVSQSLIHKNENKCQEWSITVMYHYRIYRCQSTHQKFKALLPRIMLSAVF